MKIAAVILSTLILTSPCNTSENDLQGRWISYEVTKIDPDALMGSGWVIEFFGGGKFIEEIDPGFGIVENREGTFS